MRVIFGSTAVAAAGTRVQLSNTADKVRKIQFQTRAANTGRLFIGLSDVSATVNGWELRIPTATKTKEYFDLDLGEGSVLLSKLYVDSTVNGDILDWVAITI